MGCHSLTFVPEATQNSHNYFRIPAWVLVLNCGVYFDHLAETVWFATSLLPDNASTRCEVAIVRSYLKLSHPMWETFCVAIISCAMVLSGKRCSLCWYFASDVVEQVLPLMSANAFLPSSALSKQWYKRISQSIVPNRIPAAIRITSSEKRSPNEVTGGAGIQSPTRAAKGRARSSALFTNSCKLVHALPVQHQLIRLLGDVKKKRLLETKYSLTGRASNGIQMILCCEVGLTLKELCAGSIKESHGIQCCLVSVSEIQYRAPWEELHWCLMHKRPTEFRSFWLQVWPSMRS